MLNRLFGNYLVNRGRLDQSQLDTLLNDARTYTASPETVITLNKILTPAQVQSVMENHTGEESFMETALRTQ